MTTATVLSCEACGLLETHVTGIRSGISKVPGTGRVDCAHADLVDIGEVHVPQIVHLALSTLLRRPDVLADRDTAHRIQEWIGLPARMRRTNALPWALIDGHDVSLNGLATARVLARTMSSVAAPSEAFYWKAAASIMRVRI